MMLKLASGIPGKIGDMAKGALDTLNTLTGDGEIQVKDGREPLDSPELNSAKVTSESIQQNNLAIDINDPGGNVKGTRSNGPKEIPINLNRTQGAF